MISIHSSQSTWIHGVYRGINKHKRKIAFALLICFAFIFLRSVKIKNAGQIGDLNTLHRTLEENVLSQTKAPMPTVRENENLEEELNELEWKEYNVSSNKLYSVEVSNFIRITSDRYHQSKCMSYFCHIVVNTRQKKKHFKTKLKSETNLAV